MHKTYRLFMATYLLCAAVGNAQEPPYREATRDEKLAAARQIMKSDPWCALITVDEEGQPRARTVEPFPPEKDMTVWIATNPLTRKVEQIRRNPRVTLYYNDDAGNAYVSIMGTAYIHEELETKQRKKHRLVDKYWPEFPKNYTLIEVKPSSLEVVAPSIPNDPKTWRPQGVRFDR